MSKAEVMFGFFLFVWLFFFPQLATFGFDLSSTKLDEKGLIRHLEGSKFLKEEQISLNGFLL